MGEHFFAGVAQLVEQLIRNQQASGSSPLAGFNYQQVTLSEFGPLPQLAPQEQPLGRQSC